MAGDHAFRCPSSCQPTHAVSASAFRNRQIYKITQIELMLMLTLKCYEKKILFVKVVYHKRDIYSYHQAFCFCISLRETISMHRYGSSWSHHHISLSGGNNWPSFAIAQWSTNLSSSIRIQIKIKPPNPMLSYLNFCGWRWDLRSNDPLRNKVNNLSQQRPVVRRCILSAVLLANSVFFFFFCLFESVHFISFHVRHTDSFVLGLATTTTIMQQLDMVTRIVNGERIN